MENLIKIDDLGVPLFLETPICKYKHSISSFIGTKHQLLPCQKLRRLVCPDPRRERLKDARQVLLEPEQYGSEIWRAPVDI